MLFFLVSFFLTGVLVYLYSQSHRLSFLVLSCAAIAVVWQLGLINLLGFGIDPMSILVPFLVFAIAREPRHADDQLVRVGGLRRRRPHDGGAQTASAGCWCRAFAALATDVVGFVTILFIQIRVIQEIAIAASIGVAVIILTNLVLLPVALSYVQFDARYPDRLHRAARLWRRSGAASRAWRRGARRSSSWRWRSCSASSARGRAAR